MKSFVFVSIQISDTYNIIFELKFQNQINLKLQVNSLEFNPNLNQNSQVLMQSQNDDQIESQPRLSPTNHSNISVRPFVLRPNLNQNSQVAIHYNRNHLQQSIQQNNSMIVNVSSTTPNNERKKSKIDENDVYLFYTKHTYTATIRKYKISHNRLNKIIKNKGKF